MCYLCVWCVHVYVVYTCVYACVVYAYVCEVYLWYMCVCVCVLGIELSTLPLE